ncbi:MAG: gamma-glutamyltransferase [Alphaproteobacteria bacterium]|nr:gamma-glutamyltransferase [Alphaproteobacteria bacterium]
MKTRFRCALLAWTALFPLLPAAAPSLAETPFSAEPEVATDVAPPRPAAKASRQMVAAANPIAAQAGLEILRAGGNALDAAIAIQMMLNLVEPQSSGVGGGGFLLYYAARDRSLAAYDGREMAPASATPTMFLAPDGTPYDFIDVAQSGLSVGVPGALRMLEAAHKENGKLPWAKLFEPAIKRAEDGFAISKRLFRLLESEQGRMSLMPAAGAYFYDAQGLPKPVGTILRNPALADTFRQIAANGADVLYRGPVAADIVNALRTAPRHPSGMTEKDLADYRAIKREPVCGNYRAWRVCGMPPPSTGGLAVAQTLGILENFNLAPLKPDSLEAVHLMSDAYKLAFADRTALVADPAFVDVPMARMLDRAYLNQRAALISPDRAIPGRARPGIEPKRTALDEPVSGGTSHIAAVDAEGNVVSFTTSIERQFGSGLFVRGFLLNNQLTDFSSHPTFEQRPTVNRVEPGKRPRSTMSPTIVFDADGKPVMAVGAAGGPYIIGYVTKTILRTLEWKQDVQAAIAAPNFADRNGPTELEANTLIVGLEDPLKRMGHAVEVHPLPGGIQGIVIRPGGLEGGADPRREGVAIGD